MYVGESVGARGMGGGARLVSGTLRTAHGAVTWGT
jgi:hypothetical protein